MPARREGDVPAAFRAAAHVIRTEHVIPRLAPAPLEPALAPAPAPAASPTAGSLFDAAAATFVASVTASTYVDKHGIVNQG